MYGTPYFRKLPYLLRTILQAQTEFPLRLESGPVVLKECQRLNEKLGAYGGLGFWVLGLV